jgi:hypothetical protein
VDWASCPAETRNQPRAVSGARAHKIICGGNDEYFEYLLNWMARVVQEPGAAGEVAVVLRGKEGTGKGFYAREYGRLFGRHYLQVTQTKHLVGHFNDHLRECVLLFADEAFFAGDKAHASQLKALITEKWMMIEPKGVNAFAAPNFTHIIMASNDKWTVPAGPDARRYCVLDVSAEQMRRSQYFEQMQARGRQIICSDTGSPVRLLFRPSWQ